MNLITFNKKKLSTATTLIYYINNLRILAFKIFNYKKKKEKKEGYFTHVKYNGTGR